MGEMITIPIEEFRRLQAAAEELAELHAFDRASAALVAGQEELVPAEVARRLVGGEAPLRVWREHRGLTQTALASAAAVNRVQIADIEAGRKSGSIETVGKLARALGVTLDDLV